MYLLRWNLLSLALVGAILLLPPLQNANAGGPPYGIPSGFPWQSQRYQGYSEPPRNVEPRPPQPAQAYHPPVKYRVDIMRLSQQHKAEDPNIAVLMAHLPEDASIYFQEMPTKITGMVRWFESPSLIPGKTYYYNVRVVWYEGGKWVTQTERVAVAAGEVHCIDLVKAGAAERKSEIAANLGKLSTEDRRLAEEQKSCAVQGDKLLGEMGVPVKLMVKGQPVFLCCKGCVKNAESNPDQTVARVQDLKAKNAVPALK